MNVDILCFSSLANDGTCRYDRTRSVYLDDETASARSLAQAARIPEADIATVFVNGRRSPLEHRLTEGDRVAFVPAVGGM